MKKFLLTLMMALIAVMVTAQPRTKKQLGVVENLREAPTEKKWTPRTALKNIPAPSRTKVLGKKAPRKAAISSIDDLQGDFVIANEELDVAEDNRFVPAPVAQKGNAVSIEVRSGNEIAIYGFTPDVTETDEPITATVDIANGTITIPVGQTLYTNQYGPVTLENASAEGDLTGVIYEGGIIVLNNVWIEILEYQGSQYLWGDYYHYSTLAPANGIMQYKSTDSTGTYTDQELNVLIVQDQETKDVTVYGFSIWGLAVDIELASDQSFVISSDNAVDGSEQNTSGLFYVVGSDAEGNLSLNVPGKGTATELKSDSYWTLYSWAGYWRWAQAPFTITLTDGTELEYPEAETGELVTLPDGLTPVDYTSSYTIYVDNTPTSQTSTVKIAKTGNDFYFQGLDIQIPDAWVKGTYDAAKGTVTIPVTYTGNVEGAPHFFAGYGGEDGPRALSLDYDAEGDTYSYSATIMIYKGSATTSYAYFYNGLFIGTTPTPTTAPEGLATVDMPYTGKFLTETAEDPEEVSGTVKVGRDGDDLYIQGLFESQVAGGWIKGTFQTLEGKQYVFFKKNQYVGNLSNGLFAYLTGYLPGGDGTDGQVYDVVFAYDAESNSYTNVTAVILTRFKNTDNYTAAFVDVTIGTTTGINGIKNVKNDDNAWYNLNGVRVAQPTEKGMYIHNGKKFVIK